jgi:hypothetical protein
MHLKILSEEDIKMYINSMILFANIIPHEYIFTPVTGGTPYHLVYAVAFQLADELTSNYT